MVIRRNNKSNKIYKLLWFWCVLFFHTFCHKFNQPFSQLFYFIMGSTTLMMLEIRITIDTLYLDFSLFFTLLTTNLSTGLRSGEFPELKCLHKYLGFINSWNKKVTFLLVYIFAWNLSFLLYYKYCMLLVIIIIWMGTFGPIILTEKLQSYTSTGLFLYPFIFFQSLVNVII